MNKYYDNRDFERQNDVFHETFMNMKMLRTARWRQICRDYGTQLYSMSVNDYHWAHYQTNQLHGPESAMRS
jgi:hypothetical protein